MSNRKKLGVSLSGGGLRAAFFHLGTLARMAEIGLLRHIEVLSTVSGGSIIGALYYLHLKKLLESKSDEQITDSDYLDIIQTIERDFLKATEKNLRVLTFSNWKKNLRMAKSDYTRSDRMGELFDKLIYAPAYGSTPPIPMHTLKIYPKGCQKNFHPRKDNWNRRAKVPILLINSSSLNTGRNWRFEASRMGEPQRLTKGVFDIDKIPRLETPASYKQLPKPLNNMELGKSVAASAAVPGIFKPLPLNGMYPDRTIELVDGGLHDNQGIQGLFDEGCNCFVISDASAQLEEECNPSQPLTYVLSRSSSILNARVREEQLFRVLDTEHNHRVALIHMKKGLIPPTIPLKNQSTEDMGKVESTTDIDPEVQLALSKVRTDIDAFTEIEAYSLMCLGYQLSQRELTKLPVELKVKGHKGDWQFSGVEPYLKHPTMQYLHHLKVAASTFCKVFKLMPYSSLIFTPILLLIAYLLLKQGWWKALFQSHVMSWTWGHIIISVLALIILFGYQSNRFLMLLVVLFKPGAFIYRLIYEAFIPIVGSVFSLIYLLVFNPLFLWLGRVKRLRPILPIKRTGAVNIDQ